MVVASCRLHAGADRSFYWVTGRLDAERLCVAFRSAALVGLGAVVRVSAGAVEKLQVLHPNAYREYSVPGDEPYRYAQLSEPGLNWVVVGPPPAVSVPVTLSSRAVLVGDRWESRAARKRAESVEVLDVAMEVFTRFPVKAKARALVRNQRGQVHAVYASSLVEGFTLAHRAP